jgi:uncharacterized cupin superfamily protein
MPAADISSFTTLADLQSAPIDPHWIVEGTPAARNRLVAGSSDCSAWTMLWDCTAGKFLWTYTCDETVHVLEGQVTITVNGMTNILRAGDIAFFPAGAVAFWDVENYVRKLAFCQKPVPALLGVPLRAARRLLKQLRKGLTLVHGSLAEPLPQDEAKREKLMPSRVRIRS